MTGQYKHMRLRPGDIVWCIESQTQPGALVSPWRGEYLGIRTNMVRIDPLKGNAVVKFYKYTWRMWRTRKDAREALTAIKRLTALWIEADRLNK